MLIGNVHLIAGGAETLPKLLELLRDERFDTERNPDVDIRTYPQLTVSDARALCERATMKSVAGGRRIFITIAPTLTIEAQHTLLKTLEEAPGNALFFFVVPNPLQLLPTLRSRA